MQQVQAANITSVISQENAGWGFSRILNSTVKSTSYSYDESAGEGNMSLHPRHVKICE